MNRITGKISKSSDVNEIPTEILESSDIYCIYGENEEIGY